MGVNIETMWVSDEAQLQATVQTLVAQGGQVQHQGPDEVQVLLKKKLNTVALIVGLVLCILPGLAYLSWYTLSDTDQHLTIRVGTPPTVRTGQQHWYDVPAVDGAAPGTVRPETPAPARPNTPPTFLPPPPNTLPPGGAQRPEGPPPADTGAYPTPTPTEPPPAGNDPFGV